MLNSCIIVVAILVLLCPSSSAIQVGYDSRSMIIDGERKLIFSGAIHYPRSTTEMWPDLIQKAKDGGLNAVETYIFWNAHEPRYRQYKFDGNLDFIKFFKLIQEAGLYAILRIGPYVCAEWNYGGFPVWLHNIDGIELRTDNELYKNEMQIFTTKIVEMCKEANLFALQGGPIILAQIENEYGNIESHYGDRGKAYIKWCAQMAVGQNIGVPWIMCQQADAPQPMINTCNGMYCDQMHTNDPNSPKMFTENWTGWFTKWGQKAPHRPAEDVAFSVTRFYQLGGALMNYYMYHGGTNFGRTSGGPFLITSYDYDAPLDEYAIKMGEKLITSGNVISKDITSNVQLTTFINDTTGERFCFLSNNHWERDETIDLQQDGKFFLPAWSVTILGGCQKELYNTAKVTTQTSIMVKQADNYEEDYPADPLSWMWIFESMKDKLQGIGRFSARQLLEQKRATFDHSDYLWYMTSFDNNGTSSSSKNLTLSVTSSEQAHYHVFVNGQLIGSQSEHKQFQSPVSLVPGRNNITLLSATVGLKNYGEFFDKNPDGITGPVVLTDNGNITIDLSSNTWNYKVGLNGEVKRLHDPYSLHARAWKIADDMEELPTDRSMIWYKTTFRAPSGTDPVVVDLIGMGKGQAWVNGNSIGRFWPLRIADSNGCDVECNYRGAYKNDDVSTQTRCVTNCGNPTQRWYHIPRSFLTPENNTLVLFEEIGGNPSQVSFQTVTVGSVCASAAEGSTLQLSCQNGKIISEIEFASFGDPQGTCGRSILQQGSCHSAQSLTIAEQECVGMESCSIIVSSATFGSIDCGINVTTKRLLVQATCENEVVFYKKLKLKKAQTKA
ncbi:hypothetical protein COLO4_16850 [Corchorus olitorius]|uniref:Beta-galactosidase n=1 Tax=Corchorus olitorius TaxID=93759 RepID=A0A1R3JFC6_9ROSI|nr:hypothetical protein COLO4_16850 [Corchorus olitorius]